MAEGRDAHQKAMLENFTAITGASTERALFYLEAAGWNFPVRFISISTTCHQLYSAIYRALRLQVATNTFFEEGTTHETEGEVAPMQETGGEEKSMTNPPVEVPADPTPPPQPPTVKKTGYDSDISLQNQFHHYRMLYDWLHGIYIMGLSELPVCMYMESTTGMYLYMEIHVHSTLAMKAHSGRKKGNGKPGHHTRHKDKIKYAVHVSIHTVFIQ